MAAKKSPAKSSKRVASRRRRVAYERNSHIAAARFCLSALSFSVLAIQGFLESRRNGTPPDFSLAIALAAFALVWFTLGFVERALNVGITKWRNEEMARHDEEDLEEDFDDEEDPDPEPVDVDFDEEPNGDDPSTGS